MPGRWYPDFSWGEKRCLDDGNELPYMRRDPASWIFDTNAACCEEFFGWAMQECTWEADGRPAPACLYVADDERGSCMLDCEPGPFAHPRYDSIHTCCTEDQWWVEYKYCASRSAGNYSDGWVVNFQNEKCGEFSSLHTVCHRLFSHQEALTCVSHSSVSQSRTAILQTGHHALSPHTRNHLLPSTTLLRPVARDSTGLILVLA